MGSTPTLAIPLNVLAKKGRDDVEGYSTVRTTKYRSRRKSGSKVDIDGVGPLLKAAKTLAPGEARTLDLRISLSVLTYKYDALTDCATGAYQCARAP